MGSETVVYDYLVTEQQKHSQVPALFYTFSPLLELFSYYSGSSTVVQEPIRVSDILVGTYESSTMSTRVDLTEGEN